MAQRGRTKKALNDQDVREVIDLYNWGMLVQTICTYYDIDRSTLQNYLRKNLVHMRKGRQKLPYFVRSNRREILGRAAIDPASSPSIDQLVHARARELQDKRTEQRQADASTRSCQEEAS